MHSKHRKDCIRLHPSKRFKSTAKVIGLCGIVAAFMLLLNKATVNSDTVRSFGQMGLLFVANMVMALLARYGIGHATWPSPAKRAAAAAGLVVFFMAILFVDYTISDLIAGDDGEPIQDAMATLVAAIVWVGAYAVSWKPFLQRKENRYIAAGVSLTLGLIAFTLYFRTLFSTALFGGVGWKTSFVQFSLACISVASAASAFMVQIDARNARRREDLSNSLKQSDVVLAEFEPSTDLEEAERIVSKSLLFETDVKSGWALWAYGRDVIYDAMARSTKLYAAYYQNELVGILFANEHGAQKKYERSRYSAFHRAFTLFESFVHVGSGYSSFDEIREELVASLDSLPDVEIVLFATDPELEGKGIGSKLLEAFESEFSGHTAYLAADNTLSTDFLEKRGFSLAAEKTFSEGFSDDDPDNTCCIFTKTISGNRKDVVMESNETYVTLEPLEQSDREQFIQDNQEAFNYGALEEFGQRDNHFEEDDQIISRETIEQSIDSGDAWRIVHDGRVVGGAVVSIDGDHGELELLFVKPDAHNKGIGYAAWCAIEKTYPDVKIWGLVTPYFETRNIHFYVNRCGFHIVEFYNPHHPEPNIPDAECSDDEHYRSAREVMDFRFEKVIDADF